MTKFSLSHLFIVTFWFAAVIAGISIVFRLKTGDRNEEFVSSLIVNAFQLCVFGFVIYSLFSAWFGSASLRPFWIGCTVVTIYFVFLEPLTQLGIRRLVETMISWSPGEASYFAQVHASSILVSGLIPGFGILSGLLAHSIAKENAQAETEAD